MANYYVSNTGSDSNDGKTINTPWATLNKVNASQGVIKAGDSINFKRGNTFYGNLVLPTIASTATAITVTAYGTGNKPIISAYKIGNIASSWVLQSTNIWRIDLTDVTKFTGNIYTKDANIGFLKVNGVIKPVKRFALTDLKNQWEFYSDNAKYLYVYSTAKPTSLATDIKIAPNIELIPFKDATNISYLDLCGTGGHGIDGTVHSTTVTNCDIHEIGGSTLIGFGDGKTRYGNGVEVWAGSTTVLIDSNNIYDCYDTAYTMQGDAVTSRGFVDITFTNNTLWNSNNAFEIDSFGTVANTGFFNCIIKNNRCFNAGYGWSYDVRPDQDAAGQMLSYGIATPVVDITVTNNIFYNSRNALYIDTFPPAGFKSDYNWIFLNKAQLIAIGKTYTVEQHVAFSTATGKETNSLFFAITNINNINRV